MIVIGQHTDTRRRVRRVADTMAGGILESTLKAMLVVRGDACGSYRRVVVGVDFSLFSLAAVRQAARLAPHAELHLVHAYHVPFSSWLGNTSAADQAAYSERLQLDAFRRSEMVHLKQRVEPIIQTCLEEGPPQDVLRRVSERLGADLVVIGTHSRAGVSRAIFGSVARDLLQDPPCDILVVKPYDTAPNLQLDVAACTPDDQ